MNLNKELQSKILDALYDFAIFSINDRKTLQLSSSVIMDSFSDL